MKKSLVALAALSAISAFADVDVSGGIKLYGVLDQALMSQKLTDPSLKTNSANYTGLFAAAATSRLGVKGSRDLGEGIKGFVQAELQLEPDNAALLNAAKNRTGFVGLSHADAGSVQLGTMETTAYEVFGMDVNGRVEYKPQVWRTTASADSQDRSNNSIKYITPEYAGITGHFTAATNELASSKNISKFTSYAFKYHKGNLKAALVYDNLTNQVANYKFAGSVNAGVSKDAASFTSYGNTYGGSGTTVAGAGTSAITRNIASVSYDFGTFSTNYLYAKSFTKDAYAGSLTTNTSGIKVPYEKFTFAMSIGSGSVNSAFTTDNAAAVTAADIAKKASKIGDASIKDVTTGLYYNFDKSTQVYFLGSKSSVSTGPAQAGANTTMAIGARYNF